jgi:hypothetical protein
MIESSDVEGVRKFIMGEGRAIRATTPILRGVFQRLAGEDVN